jgi:hypothetical protein
MPLTRKNQGSVSIGLVLFVLVIIAAVGVYLYAGWVGYQEAPKLIEVLDGPTQDSELYALSPGQENALLSHGYPEAFTILFYEEETPQQDIQTVRLETWEYYTLGIGLTFINGELVSEDPIEWDSQVPVIPAPYTPEQFSAFMNLEDVIAAGGIQSYIEVPLNKELMDKGVLYYAESLSFGLQEDQLVYIEALALTEE